MSDGVKLASGYVELTVKKAGDAMKEITGEIIGVGKQAGEALNKGITKGAKDAGKTVADEVESAAKDAGDKAGTWISDGINKGAKTAGKSVGDELAKAGKKAADEIGKTKIEPKVEPQVDTKRTRGEIIKDIGGAIIEAGRQGAEALGYDLDQEIIKAAGKLGKRVGEAIHDSFDGTAIGDAMGTIQQSVQGGVEVVQKMRDSILAFKQGDTVGALDGVADALKRIGASSAGDTLHDVAAKAAPMQDTFKNLKSDIKGTADGLLDLTGKSGAIAGGLTTISNAAGPLAVAFAGLTAMPGWSNSFQGLKDQVSGKKGFNAHDWLGTAVPGIGIVDNALDAAGVPNPLKNGAGPAQAPVVPPMTQAQKDAAGALILPPGLRPPGLAVGGTAGISKSGKLFGPGTPTSDSILGIGADGMPTARVSTGEGVVKQRAMENGGDAIVAALNSGWVPGFDTGTGAGGVPPPNPTLQRLLAAVQQGRILPNGMLPGNGAGEGGLQSNTIRGRRTISALFPEITDIGGYREDRLKWHPSGLALDAMIPGWNTPQGKALGDELNAFVQSNSAALGSDYTMWQVPDHYNHDHVNFAPSGYPGKDQQYALPPQLQAMLAQAEAGGGMAPAGLPAAAMGGDPASPFAAGAPGGKAGRTEGYIPAGAGGSGQAGTSLVSGALQMGAGAINGLIDQGASAAATAISAAATAGSFGAGGQAAGPAAAFAIGIGADMAKRGVQYGFQMAGIGADALAEILMPFGVPRFFQTNPTQFMPQLPGQAAGVTTGEKAEQQQDNPAGGAPSPTAPVQPGQMPGQQPVGASVPIATEGTGNFTPAPTPAGPALSGTGSPSPAAPAVPTPAPAAPPAAVAAPPPPAAPAPAPPPTAPKAPPVRDLGSYLQSLGGLAGGGVVPGLFDDGGWLMPNGLAINKTNRPEPILNDQQWSDVQAIAGRGMPVPDPKAIRGGGDDYSMHFGEGSIVVKDVEELQRELDSRQRLQRWRYGGRP